MEGRGSRAKDRDRSSRGALLLALGLLTGPLAACSSTPERAEAAYVREIKAQNRRMEELFRAADLLGVADLYADDAVLLDAEGNRTAGRDEIDEYWTSIENPVDWRLDVRSIRGSEAIAYELGTSNLVTKRDGELQTAVVDFLLLWRRAPDGVWRIALDAYWPRAK